MMKTSMEGNSNTIRVLVTGVSGGSIGEQVCKALRLGRHTYEIIATNVEKETMRVVQAEGYELLPPASSDEYLDGLLRLVDRYDIQFVIPGSEPELLHLSNNRQSLHSRQVQLLINAPDVISMCLDKKLTFEFLAKKGFDVPRTLALDSVLSHKNLSVPFPCIVKPSQGGGGSAATFLAQDQDELLFFVNYLMKYGYHPIIQEYISDAENEYTVGVLHDPVGNLLSTVVLRRQILSGLSNRLRIANRTGRPEMGKVLAISSGISQGEIVDFEPVRTTAERIAKAIGSTGPLNIQGRWDGIRFVPFEINPRFSGTTPMRALAGINEPELLIEAYLGVPQSVSVANARYGKCIRGLIEYFVPTNET
jgi:carbamoyl-phosphate synthase large subunit